MKVILSASTLLLIAILNMAIAETNMSAIYNLTKSTSSNLLMVDIYLPNGEEIGLVIPEGGIGIISQSNDLAYPLGIMPIVKPSGGYILKTFDLSSSPDRYPDELNAYEIDYDSTLILNDPYMSLSLNISDIGDDTEFAGSGGVCWANCGHAFGVHCNLQPVWCRIQ